MATARFVPPPPWQPKPKTTSLPTQTLPSSFPRQKTHLSCSLDWFLSLRRGKSTERLKILSVAGGKSAVAEEIDGESNVKEKDSKFVDREFKKQPTPCELYVCNLPTSYDISELLELFKPFGTVLSVEVSKNPETGVSRGCGYVTMGSVNSARKAITALDKSDVGGREMRVRFSVEMNSNRNPELLNSAPTRNLVYESPHKLYVGNLRWSTKPEDLTKEFSQFGTVVSARILHDRKGGKNRCYAFLSFSTAAERDAAISLDGTVFKDRVLVVRKGIERDEQD